MSFRQFLSWVLVFSIGFSPLSMAAAPDVSDPQMRRMEDDARRNPVDHVNPVKPSALDFMMATSQAAGIQIKAAVTGIIESQKQSWAEYKAGIKKRIDDNVEYQFATYLNPEQRYAYRNFGWSSLPPISREVNPFSSCQTAFKKGQKEKHGDKSNKAQINYFKLYNKYLQELKGYTEKEIYQTTGLTRFPSQKMFLNELKEMGLTRAAEKYEKLPKFRRGDIVPFKNKEMLLEESIALRKITSTIKFMRMLVEEVNENDLGNHVKDANELSACVGANSGSTDCDQELFERVLKDVRRLYPHLRISMALMNESFSGSLRRIQEAILWKVRSSGEIRLSEDLSTRKFRVTPEREKLFDPVLNYGSFYRKFQCNPETGEVFGSNVVAKETTHQLYSGSLWDGGYRRGFNWAYRGFGYLGPNSERIFREPALKNRTSELSKIERRIIGEILNTDLDESTLAYDKQRQIALKKFYGRVCEKSENLERCAKSQANYFEFIYYFHLKYLDNYVSLQRSFYHAKYQDILKEMPFLAHFSVPMDAILSENEILEGTGLSKDVRSQIKFPYEGDIQFHGENLRTQISEALESVRHNAEVYQEYINKYFENNKDYPETEFAEMIKLTRINRLDGRIPTPELIHKGSAYEEYIRTRPMILRTAAVNTVLKKNPRYCDLAHRILKDYVWSNETTENIATNTWGSLYSACIISGYFGFPGVAACITANTAIGTIPYFISTYLHIMDERYQLARIYNVSEEYRDSFEEMSKNYQKIRSGNSSMIASILWRVGMQQLPIGDITSGFSENLGEWVGNRVASEALEYAANRAAANIMAEARKFGVQTITDAMMVEGLSHKTVTFEMIKPDYYKSFSQLRRDEIKRGIDRIKKENPEMIETKTYDITGYIMRLASKELYKLAKKQVMGKTEDWVTKKLEYQADEPTN